MTQEEIKQCFENVNEDGLDYPDYPYWINYDPRMKPVVLDTMKDIEEGHNVIGESWILKN